MLAVTANTNPHPSPSPSPCPNLNQVLAVTAGHGHDLDAATEAIRASDAIQPQAYPYPPRLTPAPNPYRCVGRARNQQHVPAGRGAAGAAAMLEANPNPEPRLQRL